MIDENTAHKSAHLVHANKYIYIYILFIKVLGLLIVQPKLMKYVFYTFVVFFIFLHTPQYLFKHTNIIYRQLKAMCSVRFGFFR